jgi:putative NADH-flavin reductase
MDMKITVFGSTGKAGLELIRQALKNDFIVVAFARNPSKIDIKHQNHKTIKGELNDIAA